MPGASTTGSNAGGCRRSFSPTRRPSAGSRSGWTPTGPETSRSCSAWSAAGRSCGSWNWCSPRAGASSRRRGSPGRARSAGPLSPAICGCWKTRSSSTWSGRTARVSPRRSSRRRRSTDSTPGSYACSRGGSTCGTRTGARCGNTTCSTSTSRTSRTVGFGTGGTSAGTRFDFVVGRRSGPPTAVECKWRSDGFDGRNLRAFRARYPGGDNFVVTFDTEASYVRNYRGIDVRFVDLPELIRRAAGPR